MDLGRDYAQVSGSPTVAFEQDGREFDSDGISILPTPRKPNARDKAALRALSVIELMRLVEKHGGIYLDRRRGLGFLVGKVFQPPAGA